MIIVREIKVESKGLYKECLLGAMKYDDFRIDFQALFAAILENTKITMIFLEELSNIQPKLEERIKDVQNSSSNSDREQDHKRAA